MRMKTARFGRRGLLLVMTLLLASCVTTTSTVFKETDEKDEIDKRVEAASTYLTQGRTDQAIFHLKKALKLDDRSPAVHDALAGVFRRTGETELSEQHYLEAISYDKSYSRARNNYASLLYQLGRYDEAMSQLELVVADILYEKRSDAFISLGRCAQKLNRLDRAEEAYTRALMMDDSNDRAVLELASINYNRGDFATANRYYEEFRRRDVRQTAGSLLLGIRLARVFEDRDAEASHALALKNLYPQSQEYLDYRDELLNKKQ